MKRIIALMVALFLFMLPLYAGNNITGSIKNDNEMGNSLNDASPSSTNDNTTNYWALIVAVGVYAFNPSMDRPSMLTASDALYKTLLVSPWWNSSHIRYITGKNATVLSIMSGFRWLAKNAGPNDICLIYLTTHGFPILFDLPPRDETDGMDEALAAYRGFLPFPNPWSWEPLANPFGIITDDEINFMLNRIHAKGIAMIVDSCHSGGFNDNWSYAKNYNMAYELGKDLMGRNRVIVTSVAEDEVSYGSIFSMDMIRGLQGYGDKNNDGLCSIEEAFYYTEPKVLNWSDNGMHPQIFDDYPGELVLTQKELPPSMPSIDGPEMGSTNTTYYYNITSSDPENDRIKYIIDWGDEITETDYFDSGKMVRISHSWNKEGTYEIKIKAIDEDGAESGWSYGVIVTVADPYHRIDQRQVNMWYAYLINDTRWLAQSFVPSVSKIDKIDLAIICWNDGYDITLSIKDSLDGKTIASASKKIEPTEGWDAEWVSFKMNANVEPGKEYYMVCNSSKSGWGIAWAVSGENDYSNGTFYDKNEGKWYDENIDACFVTYGN